MSRLLAWSSHMQPIVVSPNRDLVTELKCHNVVTKIVFRRVSRLRLSWLQVQPPRGGCACSRLGHNPDIHVSLNCEPELYSEYHNKNHQTLRADPFLATSNTMAVKAASALCPKAPAGSAFKGITTVLKCNLPLKK